MACDVAGDQTQDRRKGTGIAANQPKSRETSQLLLRMDEFDHQTSRDGDHVQHCDRDTTSVREPCGDHDGEDYEEEQESAGRHAEEVGLEDVVAETLDDDAAELESS